MNAMSKRKVDDAASTKMDREVQSMKVKMMKSELMSLGISILGIFEKDDLIDVLLRARRGTGHAVPSSSSQMLPSLRDFARLFKDANVPDLVCDAMTLVEAAWDGSVEAEEEGTPLARTIKHGSAELCADVRLCQDCASRNHCHGRRCIRRRQVYE